jgi:hypothetical protein
MDEAYLRNTIKSFKNQDLDLEPLEKELRNRQVQHIGDSVERVLKWLKAAGEAAEISELRRSARAADRALKAYWDQFSS